MVFGGQATGLTVAGRTDAGVHATGQVCHVDVPTPRWTEIEGTLVRRLAGLLPPDARVSRVAAVPAAFDARFSALWRRYRYRVCDHPAGAPPLRHRDTLAWRGPLDADLLNEASVALLGEHDFAAFCQAMVRSLVGALLAVGDGRRQPQWPGSLLMRRERANEVVVAPPHGLTLVGVGYPDDPADYARRAALTRNRRGEAQPA